MRVHLLAPMTFLVAGHEIHNTKPWSWQGFRVMARRGESNPHELSPSRSTICRVYQFRHAVTREPKPPNHPELIQSRTLPQRGARNRCKPRNQTNRSDSAPHRGLLSPLV